MCSQSFLSQKLIYVPQLSSGPTGWKLEAGTGDWGAYAPSVCIEHPPPRDRSNTSLARVKMALPRPSVHTAS